MMEVRSATYRGARFAHLSRRTGAAMSEPVDHDPGQGDDGKPIGRRVVLGMIGLGALGVFFGKHAQDVENAVLRPIELHDPTGLSSLIPAGDQFRFYSITGSEPQRTNADYRLTVGGLVDRPATFTFADLQAMPQTSLIKDFQCVTGWRVPGVHWSGVALPDLLDHVGVQKGATALAFTSFDGAYTESLTLSQAQRRDVLVATSMLGGAVSRDHGGPVRLYVAPMYGYKSCKWLGGIQLTSSVQPGYWENNGYDVDAWVGKSNGRDDAPTS
jgi:DMSO/TMAO reductase YedYZ molybdopterin-dependent catalytic subunit